MNITFNDITPLQAAKLYRSMIEHCEHCEDGFDHDALLDSTDEEETFDALCEYVCNRLDVFSYTPDILNGTSIKLPQGQITVVHTGNMDSQDLLAKQVCYALNNSDTMRGWMK